MPVRTWSRKVVNVIAYTKAIAPKIDTYISDYDELTRRYVDTVSYKLAEYEGYDVLKRFRGRFVTALDTVKVVNDVWRHTIVNYDKVDPRVIRIAPGKYVAIVIPERLNSISSLYDFVKLLANLFTATGDACILLVSSLLYSYFMMGFSLDEIWEWVERGLVRVRKGTTKADLELWMATDYATDRLASYLITDMWEIERFRRYDEVLLEEQKEVFSEMFPELAE